MLFAWTRRFGFNQPAPSFLAPVVLLFGAFLLLLAGGFWLHEHHLNSKAAHATGTVTELETRRETDGTIIIFPRVRFSLPTGRTVQFTGHTGSNPASYNAGNVVQVKYAPDHPAAASITTRWDTYKSSILLGILGISLFDLGFAWEWLARRHAKKISRGSADTERAEKSAATRAANFWGGGRRE